MAIKYVPYFPNTLEGQAVLDNFVRTKRVLRYRDNGQVIERVQRGMPLYEIELKEQIGQNPNNLVIRGECVSACAYLRDKGSSAWHCAQDVHLQALVGAALKSNQTHKKITL